MCVRVDTYYLCVCEWYMLLLFVHAYINEKQLNNKTRETVPAFMTDRELLNV